MIEQIDKSDFQFNNAGRATHFDKLFTGDCATRAISIATGEMYWKIWQDLTYEKQKLGKRNADHGVPVTILEQYLKNKGWVVHKPEKNEKVFFNTDTFSVGTTIVEIRKHMATIVDGVLNDTYYSIQSGKKRVLQYWTRP